jgi:ribosome maturation factor RimP
VSGGAGGPRFFIPVTSGEVRKELGSVAIPLPDLERELDVRLERMGFELVDATWAGSPGRPILRVRLDLPDSVPGKGGVSVGQCAEVSRALEPWLDEHPGIPDRYILEVSSPGVDRPLTRDRDWIRFRGQIVRVKGRDLPGGGGRRMEGELLGFEEEESGEMTVTLLLQNGDRVRIPRDRIEGAHLVYRWEP